MPAIPKGHVTLTRALSKLGLASRTEAAALIASGRVSIDGRIERNPARTVVPERAQIRIDGEAPRRDERVVVMLNKPRGVVTTRRDPEGRTTAYDCLAGLSTRVEAVGRLDAASTGLLLFTNDTKLAHWLTDPANAIPRTYVVTVRGRVSDDDAARMASGIDDRGERLAARRVEVLKASGRESHLRVELVEGRNREIRRMCEAIGHEVTRLKRIAFGGVLLGDLPAGKWRPLTPSDEALLTRRQTS